MPRRMGRMGPTSGKPLSGVLLVILLAGAKSAEDITITNPGKVALGEKFHLDWESVGATKNDVFDIELYTNAMCSGTPIADLCDESESGCHSAYGGYGVVIPEATGVGERSILVSVRGGDPDVRGCSGLFFATEAQPDGDEGCFLDVSSPAEDVMAGFEFSALWEYNDGHGATENWFSIELYTPNCEGPVIAHLCDDPDTGCTTSLGIYPVTIPDRVPEGQYSLRVGVVGAASPVGCSPPFVVEAFPKIGDSIDSIPSLQGVRDALSVKTSLAVGAVIDLDVNVETPWAEHQVEKVPCDPTIAITVRYAESSLKSYFEHVDDKVGGCANLTMLLDLRSESDGRVKGPLYPLDPVSGEKLTHAQNASGHWLLESDLYIRNGVTLQLYGTASGGDCDALRILSTDTEHYNLRGHGGSLDIMDTIITSWDMGRTPPGPRLANQTTYTDDTNPRSYISCLSEIVTNSTETCYGRANTTRGECRMDILRSEVAYLGYYGAEAYGLTWKVRGFCKHKGNPEVFDTVNTYGDVRNSDIHHLFYGLYTYGHIGGLWTNNLMHDNEWYGFDPHDDSDYLTIHNNKVWNNGKHGIIASKRCNHVSIQNNEVWSGGETAAGIFLHRSSDYAIVKGNFVHDMQDAGLATLESFQILFANNHIEHCKYGIRLSLGAGDNIVHGNTFRDLTSYGFFTYVGSNDPDVPGGAYRPHGNKFIDNLITAPAVLSVGMKLKEADTSLVIGNTLENTVLMEIDNSDTTWFVGNTYDENNTSIEVKNGACFQPGSGLFPWCKQ